MNVPRDLTSAGMLPLIVVIKVHAYDIEIAWIATELGAERARQHVARFELAVSICRGFASQLRAAFRRNHVNHRLDDGDPRARRDVPDCIDAGNACANELPLQFTAASFSVRIEPPDLAGRPGEKRHLVDRRVERHAVAAIAHVSGNGASELSKSIDERRTEDVESVRPPVVA